MKIINNIFYKKENINYDHSDINELKIEKNISDIYIIGNGLERANSSKSRK